MRALPTEYRGVTFRSRLEARWAKFFDLMGLRWEYEPEGFCLEDGTNYLPDFRVYTPQGKECWYEVKPTVGADDGKFGKFAEEFEAEIPESDGPVWPRLSLLAGTPLEVMLSTSVLPPICPRCGVVGDHLFNGYGSHGYLDGGDTNDTWSCGPCDFETPCGSDNPPELGVRNLLVVPHKGSLHVWGGSSDFLDLVFDSADLASRAQVDAPRRAAKVLR